MATLLPSLFVSHGSPTLPLEDSPAHHFLAGLGDRLPRPKAILAVSAHWETDNPMLSSTAQPETIHDFYGFPEALYAMRYEAPGAPDLAEEIAERLTQAGFEARCDAKRGLDHGAWSPLTMIYPDQDIPVLQLSVQTGKSPEHHIALGRALAPLRAEGILILGSGSLTHNLMEWRRLRQAGIEAVPDWVTEFQTWVHDCVLAGDLEALSHFHAAPNGVRNHPTDEHFLPFFVALGAGLADEPDGTALGERLHDSVSYTVLAMDAYSFGGA